MSSANALNQLGRKIAAQRDKKKADAAKAAQAKKQAIAADEKRIAGLEGATVSERVQQALGSGLKDKMAGDIAKGAAFGEAVVGEGLGRIGDDPTVAAMEAQAAELAKGMSSEEMQARKEQGLEEISGTAAAQSRAAQARLARSGVKGQAAGAQLAGIAQTAVEARGDLERDLMLQERQAQIEGLGIQSKMVGENRRFDIGQAAKEKDIALQAGLGFAQMGAAERGAAASARAQVKAAKASKQSCFVQGTKIKMKDGSTKNIENIKIGDELMYGGVVYSLLCSLVSEVYDIDGVQVSGGHAILSGNKWKRARDVGGRKLEGIFPVYNLSNERHRICTDNDQLWADFEETDFCDKINDNQSLEVLNGNGSKVLEGRRGV
jgi:hypothetical protein